MNNKNLVISYPRMGNYHILLEKSLKMLFPYAEILTPPPISARTLEIGTRHSPESVCAPFKYNVGNFVEVLDMGANVLAQTGLGCIFGYYGELQEQILKDLGYDFDFLCFSQGKVAMQTAFAAYKKLGGKRSFATLSKACLSTINAMLIMDKFEYKMRENMAFEAYAGTHEALHQRFLDDLKAASIVKTPILWHHYKKELDNIELKEPREQLRIGLVGELFTLMEPSSNFNLEKELADAGCSVSRKMNASLLVFSRKVKSLQNSGGYLVRLPGANGADTVSQAVAYAKLGYDGIIHMKSFGCTPEINVMPALNKLSQDMGLPVLHLSFDTHTGEAGLQTRLEAFIDMLRMRKAGGVLC